MELTINLPDAVFQQLRAISDLTEQPLGDLVLQSIAGNLPLASPVPLRKYAPNCSKCKP